MGDSASFSAETQAEPVEEIPPGTSYTWNIQSTTLSSDSNNITLYGAVIDHTFSLWGEYRVSVIGTYPSGSFIGELTVVVQGEYLSSLQVQCVIVIAGGVIISTGSIFKFL